MRGDGRNLPLDACRLIAMALNVERRSRQERLQLLREDANVWLLQNRAVRSADHLDIDRSRRESTPPHVGLRRLQQPPRRAKQHEPTGVWSRRVLAPGTEMPFDNLLNLLRVFRA